MGVFIISGFINSIKFREKFFKRSKFERRDSQTPSIFSRLGNRDIYKVFEKEIFLSFIQNFIRYILYEQYGKLYFKTFVILKKLFVCIPLMDYIRDIIPEI